MLSLEAERIVGYQARGRANVAAGVNGEFLYPSSVGIVVSHVDSQAEGKLWVPGDGLHSIGLVRFHPSHSTVVVAERRLKVALLVFSYPQRRQLQRIADVCRVNVADLQYSRDGTRLVLLADAPQCTVTIYTVDSHNGKLAQLAQSSSAHAHLLQHVSACPTNLQVFCASGGGHLLLWQLDPASNALHPTEGRVTSAHVRLTGHAWLPNGDVACGTTRGSVFAFTPHDGVGRQVFQIANNNPDGDGDDANGQAGGTAEKDSTSVGVTQIVVSRLHYLLGCSDGCILFVDHRWSSVHFVVRTTMDTISAMQLTPEWHSLLVTSDHAIGLVHLPGYEDARRDAEDVKRQGAKVSTLVAGAADDGVGVCHHRGSSVTIVDKRGVGTTYDYNKNAITNVVSTGEGPLVVRRFGEFLMAVTSSTGTVRVVDVTKPAANAVVLRAKVGESALTICEVTKDHRRLLVSDGRVAAFFAKDGPDVVLEGVLKINSASPVSLLSWVEGYGGFLLVQSNGDVSLYSCPFFDDAVGENAEGVKELTTEQLFVNSWRLDFPVVGLVVCAFHDEACNLLVHSLDKETKLYLLDRTLSVDRKDRETKAIKPQVTMKDHEKRGNALRLVRAKYLLSAGGDGKLALRDIAAYTNRLTPAPTAKEKRDAVATATRHVSAMGGVVGLALSDDESRVVTVGGDGNLVVWALGKQQAALPAGPLKLPLASSDLRLQYVDPDDAIFYSEKRRVEQHELERLRCQDQRASVAKALERLRDRLQQVRVENDAAAPEEKVPLEDFLVEQQKAHFEEQCALAVQEMADEEHMANLNRDYVTNVIKRECWDVMDTKLTKLRAMNTTAQVFNFHERKTPPQDLVLLRKLKFMRLVEMRDAEVRGVKSLSDLHERNPAESEQQGKSDASSPDNSPLVEPLTVGKKSLELEAQEDPKPFLYHHLAVFTKQRAIVQLTLLKGRSYFLRSAFNKQFAELIHRKKQDLIKIEERNVRCRQVLKELDEERSLFAPGFAPDEDPKFVFAVADSEVPADKSTDPDEKKRVANEAEEKRRWIERHGSDDSADKALKAWMDGRLDKEVRTLEIKIDKPEFADETSEKYVAPEDRNDDQQRVYREYEKALAKRIEEVTAKRAALQAEFAQLQKENVEQAKKFDVLVTELFQKRLLVHQQCHEVELSQVKLAQGSLMVRERARLARKMEAHRQSLSDQHARAVRATLAAKAKLSTTQHKLDSLREEEKNKEKNLRSTAPFTDPEWGESLVRLFTKKKPKKPDGKAKRAGGDAADSVTAGATAGANAVDPFAFVEGDQQLRLRRFADDPQFQLPKLDQGDFPSPVWDAFQKYRLERIQAERDMAMLGEDAVEQQHAVEKCEEVEHDLAQQERDAFEQFEAFQRESLREQFDVDELHIFRQGQVEVEQAPVVTDYADAVLIHASQIQRLNKLIRASGAEKIQLLREINEKRKDIRLLEWDMEHLAYGTQTMEMELRHLHTLRVTKQMQEYLGGGGEDHNEKERVKLTKHIAHVKTTMAAKIEERRQQILRLRRAVKDKELENMLLLDQVAECKGLVDERKAIRDLQSAELDAERTDKLMKDMRVTRKLEDVAKAQQEEMLLHKKEIDRLRERTFPSFAVVSKRVVGNPDQQVPAQ